MLRNYIDLNSGLGIFNVNFLSFIFQSYKWKYNFLILFLDKFFKDFLSLM